MPASSIFFFTGLKVASVADMRHLRSSAARASAAACSSGVIARRPPPLTSRWRLSAVGAGADAGRRCASCGRRSSRRSARSTAAASHRNRRARELFGITRHQLHLAEADRHVRFDDVFRVRHRSKTVGDRSDLNAFELRVHVGKRQRQWKPCQRDLAKVASRQLQWIMAAAHLESPWTPWIHRRATAHRTGILLYLVCRLAWGFLSALLTAQPLSLLPFTFYLLPFAFYLLPVPVSRLPASIASPGSASAARKVSRNDCASIEYAPTAAYARAIPRLESVVIQKNGRTGVRTSPANTTLDSANTGIGRQPPAPTSRVDP